MIHRLLSTLRYHWQAGTQVPPGLAGDLVAATFSGHASEAGRRIRALREALMKDTRVLEFEDLGAGHRNQGPGLARRSVASMARISSRSEQEGEFLHRLCAYLQPAFALELGTNLGLSALYQLSAMPACHLITVEGVEAIAAIARETWQAWEGPVPALRTGNFDEVLDALAREGFSPEYVLLDGDHREASTLRYLRKLLTMSSPEAVFVLDDIRWSRGMERAWQEAISWPAFSLSIDLGSMGLLMRNTGSPKEHLVLKAPWSRAYHSKR